MHAVVLRLQSTNSSVKISSEKYCCICRLLIVLKRRHLLIQLLNFGIRIPCCWTINEKKHRASSANQRDANAAVPAARCARGAVRAASKESDKLSGLGAPAPTNLSAQHDKPAAATGGKFRVCPGHERAAARVCREAGGTVATHVLARDLNVVPFCPDERRIEVIANGLPLWGGGQLAVDTTLVSPLTAAGLRRKDESRGTSIKPGKYVLRSNTRRTTRPSEHASAQLQKTRLEACQLRSSCGVAVANSSSKQMDG